MATFDLNSYLDKRYGAANADQKMADIAEASFQKTQQLTKVKQAFQADQAALAAQEQANSNAWTNQLGLEPDSVAGGVVNALASYTTGAGRLAGHVASLPASVGSELQLSGLTQEDFDAYAASQQGTATPEQQQRLATRRAMGGDPNQLEVNLPVDEHARQAQLAREKLEQRYAQRNQSRYPVASPQEKIAKSDNLRELARDINTGFDFSSTVNQTARQGLSTDLREGFKANWDKVVQGGTADKLEGIAGLLGTVGSAAANNKQASLEYIIENVPQIVAGLGGGAGMATLTASNLGYAVDNYQQGIEKFQKENRGAYPDEQQRQEMAMWALSTAAAEQAGDVVGLGGAKALKAALLAARDGAEAMTAGAAKNALKAALKVPMAIAGGGATEALTEGYQTFAEGKAQLKDASAADIFEGAAIGGIVGGAMRGAPTAAAQLVEATTVATNAVQARRDATEAEDSARTEALNQATETGDVSGLIDPKKKTYAPDVAISALYNRSQEATEEEKQTNLNQATEILDTLTQRVEDARTDMEAMSPEAVNGYKDQLAEVEAEIAATQDPQEIADLTERRDALESIIEEASPENVKGIRDNLTRMESQLKAAQDALGNFTRESAPKDVDVGAEIQNIKTADPEVAQASADRVISLAMRDASRLDEKVAASLAADEKNGLSGEQRAYLRAFSEARIAENQLSTMGKVSKEVLYGSPKNVGIAQYRQRVQAALASGNERVAARQLEQLKNFEADHVQKAAAAQEALAMGGDTQIVRNVNGTWEIPSEPLSTKALRSNGGLVISNPRLVNQIQTEADALTKAVNEIESAINIRFKKGTPDVQDQPRNPTQPQNPSNRAAEVGSVSPQSSESGRVQPQDADEDGSGRTAGEPAQASPEVQVDPQLTETTEVEGTQALGVFNLNAAEELAKPFDQRNLVAAYLKQNKSRVLGKTPDYLSNAGTLAEELSTADEPVEVTPEQEAAFAFLKEKVQEWGPILDSNIELRPDAVRYGNPFEFMINKDGMNENIHTAMTLAVMDYVAQFGSRTLFNDWSDINAILHRPEETQVSPKEVALLRDVGTQATVVTSSVGQLASQVLGLKDNSDTPKNLLPKVEAGMGAYIVDLMVQQGILEKNQVDGNQLNQAMEIDPKSDAAYKPQVKLTFYRLATNADGNFTPEVRQIFDAIRDSRNAFSDLFGVEMGVVAPKLVPTDFNQKTIKGTDRGIPAPLKEANDKFQKTPFLVKKDHWNLLSQLPDEVALAFAGYSNVDASVQASKRDGMESINDSLQKGWDGFKEFVNDHLGGDLDREFYVEPMVWINQRVGVKTKLVDPQANKLHRYITKMGTWDVKVDLTNQQQMDNFRLRVMEGLGDKTDETVDSVTLQRYDALVFQPAIANAVAAIRKSLQGATLTPADQNAIVQGVAKGGEKMHSLDALMALAKQAEAQANGQTTFEAEMSVEDDGKTNGPMLSYLLFGASYDAENLKNVMEQGGFYTEDSGITQYSQWRAQPGNEDLYQSTMRVFHSELSRVVNEARIMGNQEFLNKTAAIYAFTGSLVDETKNKVEKAGRNIVKTPLQAIFFGSSSKRSAESMADKLIEGITDRIQKLPGNPDDRVALIKDLNTLGIKTAPNTTIETLMGKVLDKREIRTLQQTFMSVIGESVKESVDSHFAPFMYAKQTMNTAANLTFNLYNATFQAMKQKKLAELVQAGEIPVSKGKNPVPLFDLSKNQEKELHDQLKNVFPQMHSWMSQVDGNLNNGLRIAKEDASLSNNSTYFTEVKTKAGTHRIRSRERNLVEPGVMMLSASVHSFDSGISHMAGMKVDSINNHDARTTGVNELNALAKSLNQATWEGLLAYSPLGATSDALSRTIVGLAELVESGALNTEDIGAIRQALVEPARKAKMTPDEFLASALQNVKAEYERADRTKLEFMSTMGAVDQYPLQGGSYIVTEEDRKAAEAKLAEVNGLLNEKENAALDTLYKALTSKDVKRARPTKPVAPPAPVGSPFGELGTPRLAVDEELVAFLEANPRISAKELSRELFRLIAKTPETHYRNFSMKLLRTINHVLDENTPVNYITKLTPENGVKDIVPGAHAWFTMSPGGDEINILGNDFVNARLRPSTLIHEMVHATTAKTIAQEQAKKKANPKYTSEALDAIADMELLMEKAEKYIDDNGFSNKYAAATENVSEFLAYGMMLPSFQQDILRNITINSSETSFGKFTNGLRNFIINVARIFFGQDRSLSGDVDGMTAVIAGTMSLMSIRPETNVPTQSLAMSIGNPMASLENMDTVTMYNALANGVSPHAPEFNERVQDVMQNLVNKLHGPFGAMYDKAARKAASDPMDVMVKAIQAGTSPFIADVAASPFRASPQEMFAMEQIEATVRAALDSGEASSTSLAGAQLSKLYREAYQRIKPENFLKAGATWATATPAEKATAQAQYDFVFKINTAADGRSDYLSRFAALGMGHEAFGELLGFDTSLIGSPAQKDITIGDRVQRVFEKILDALGSKIIGTFAGQKADEKLDALVDRLVDIEAKRRLGLAATRNAWVTAAEDTARNVSESIKNLVMDVAGSQKIRNSASGYVRGAGAVARTIAGDNVDKVLEGFSRMRDAQTQKRHSFVRDMITQVQGLPDRYLKLLLDAKRVNEQQRQDAIASTEKTVLESFENGGKNLTQQERESVTQTLLRSGAHTLLKSRTIQDLATLVGDKAARTAEIKKVEAELNTVATAIGKGKNVGNLFAYYVEKANVLGHYKATGYVRRAHMLMNAFLISNLDGTSKAGIISEKEAAQAQAIIEQLVSLYALDYSGTADLANTKNVMLKEANRADGNNGVEFMLKLQTAMEEESLKTLFKNNPALMLHGYTPELFNNNTQMKIASGQDAKNLELQGWKKIGSMEQDPSDPVKNTKQYMFVLRGAGLTPYLSGVFSLSDLGTKGSKLHSGFLDPNTNAGVTNLMNNGSVYQDHTRSDDALLNRTGAYRRDNLAIHKGNFMAPVFNEQGIISNYRYLMNEQTKDTILERDSRFEKVMGMYAGSIYDKQNSRDQNKEGIKAIKADYDENYKDRPKAFVHVGRDSTDLELREIWNLLPDSTKADVEAVWGYKGMMVRSDMLNPLFGFRKYSLAEIFRKDPDARNQVEKFVGFMVEWNMQAYARHRLGMNEQDANEYAKRAANYVARGEQVWQEMVKEIKDIIVIKSIGVMVGNIWSNISYLMLSGVSLKEIIKHHRVAMKASTAYMADTQDLERLRLYKESGYVPNGQQDIDREIARLQDAVNRNPIKELIDAGLMPTIVDDVAIQDDPYSYKSYLNEWVGSKTQNIPEGIKTIGRTLYMTKDTGMYQSLSRITQLSDFVARYTLYQHMVQRSNNPLSKEQAVLEAAEAFVNYDIPMPKGLQYTDDMGITMFTKYFLRIQKVLVKLVKEQPLRVLMLIALNKVMSLGSVVTEGSWFSHIGNNPLNWGAFQYPTTLDELGTIQAAQKLID